MKILDELEALLAAATQGEWCTSEPDGEVCAFVGEQPIKVLGHSEWDERDERLALAAVNTLPELIAVARAAERFIEFHDTRAVSELRNSLARLATKGGR